MKRRVVWSDTARDNYLALLRTIAEDNPDAAGRVSGTCEKVLPGLPYILAYELVSRPEGGEVVAILHVIHGARDWPAGEWPADR